MSISKIKVIFQSIKPFGLVAKFILKLKQFYYPLKREKLSAEYQFIETFLFSAVWQIYEK